MTLSKETIQNLEKYMRLEMTKKLEASIKAMEHKLTKTVVNDAPYVLNLKKHEAEWLLRLLKAQH